MKKLYLLLSCIVVSICLCSCGFPNPSQPSTSESSSGQVSSANTETALQDFPFPNFGNLASETKTSLSINHYYTGVSEDNAKSYASELKSKGYSTIISETSGYGSYNVTLNNTNNHIGVTVSYASNGMNVVAYKT